MRIAILGAAMAMLGTSSVFGTHDHLFEGGNRPPRWYKRHGDRSVSVAQAKREAKKRKNIAKRAK